MKLLDLAAVLFFNFLRKLCTVSVVAVPFYNPRQYQKIPFLHILVNIVIDGLFDNSHPDRCEMVSLCGLICISLFISDVEHLFMCLLPISMLPLEKCLFVSIV